MKKDKINKKKERKDILVGVFLTMLIICLLVVSADSVRADIASGLVAHWKFDDMNDPTSDSSGNGHTCTLEGGTSWVAGKIGTNALNFDDATSSYVDCGNGFNLGTSDWTISFWINQHSDTGTFMTAIAKGKNNGDGDILIYDLSDF